MALHPSLAPGLSTTDFWNQGAQMAAEATFGLSSMSVPLNDPIGYGVTPNGFCLPCATSGYNSLCSTPSATGKTNPIVPCVTGQVFHCKHPTMQDCYGNNTKAGLVAGLAPQPYGAVMMTSFAQPTYGTAFQTMMSGQL